MPKAKVAITLESSTLQQLDQLVHSSKFPNRSQAIEAAVIDKLARLEHRRLADECGKLDPPAEQRLADEGLAADVGEWPAY